MANRCVVTIGTFDGVHVGHRAILTLARHVASAGRMKVVALAFDPSPARVLRSQQEPPRLTGPEQKRQLLREAGADDVQFLEPTPQFLDQSPQQFVRWLMEHLELKALVEGENFRFGKGRSGDVVLLQKMSSQLSFDVLVVDSVQVALTDQLRVSVSSTLIRWLVEHGRVADAARCLGRAYELRGSVVVGEHRGRRMGVPTANLDPAALDCRLIPADGVYAGRVRFNGAAVCPAAISVGMKATFGGEVRCVEAHLLDFSGDLYGQTIGIEPLRWLRDQQCFPRKDALKAQLRRDIEQTRWFYERGVLDLSHNTTDHIVDRQVGSGVGA